MSVVSAKQQMVQKTITAVVTRADGTTENLGTIVYWHRSPFRRFLWRVQRLIRRV